MPGAIEGVGAPWLNSQPVHRILRLDNLIHDHTAPFLYLRIPHLFRSQSKYPNHDSVSNVNALHKMNMDRTVD